MTHDELLKKVNEEVENAELRYLEQGLESTKALRAVVELHKPVKDNFYGDTVCLCGVVEPTHYPCPTIEAIEKELK